MKYRLLVTLLVFITTTSVWADSKKQSKNILSLKETITDYDIKFPDSFNESNDMLKNWYNLYHETNAPIDQPNDRQYGNVSVSDNVYKERLQKLPTSIEMPFNQIVKSYIERYVVKGRSMVSRLLGMSNYYMPIFEEALARHHMPLELKYIPIIESALNPNAVSPAGAGGLWQFMPSTAKGHGIEVSNTVDQRRDPYVSSDKAAVFFKKLYDTYGDWSLAIAAYNCGPGNVNKAIKRTGNEKADFWEIYNYLPKETRGYVPAFIAANYVMTYYKDHGISPQKTKAFAVDTVIVKRRVTFSQISRVLNIPIDEIRILNPQYRGDVIPGNVHPYYLALKSQDILRYLENESKIIGGGGSSSSTSKSDPIEYELHIVKEGETIYDIADIYGISEDDIIRLNSLRPDKDEDEIILEPGLELKVFKSKKKKTTPNNNNNINNNYEEDEDGYYYLDDDKPQNKNNNSNNNYNNYNNEDDDIYYDSPRQTTNTITTSDGRDNRNVPASQRRKVNGGENEYVPSRTKNDDDESNYYSSSRYSNNYDEDSYNDNTSYDDEEEELRRQEEAAAKKEAARKKKAAEEAAKKKAAKEAAKKKELERKEAAKKKAAEEAKKKKAAEEAAKKKAAEEAAKKKAAEEAAKKKAAEEAAKRKAAEEAKKPINHKVSDGENLTKIATRYGVSVQDIKKHNNITDDNKVRSGSTLKIPKKGQK